MNNLKIFIEKSIGGAGVFCKHDDGRSMIGYMDQAALEKHHAKVGDILRDLKEHGSQTSEFSKNLEEMQNRQQEINAKINCAILNAFSKVNEEKAKELSKEEQQEISREQKKPLAKALGFTSTPNPFAVGRDWVKETFLNNPQNMDPSHCLWPTHFVMHMGGGSAGKPSEIKGGQQKDAEPKGCSCDEPECANNEKISSLNKAGYRTYAKCNSSKEFYRIIYNAGYETIYKNKNIDSKTSLVGKNFDGAYFHFLFDKPSKEIFFKMLCIK